MTHHHITALAIVAATATVVVEKCAPQPEPEPADCQCGNYPTVKATRDGGLRVERVGSVSNMRSEIIRDVKICNHDGTNCKAIDMPRVPVDEPHPALYTLSTMIATKRVGDRAAPFFAVASAVLGAAMPFVFIWVLWWAHRRSP